jgi:hypothetical protein
MRELVLRKCFQIDPANGVYLGFLKGLCTTPEELSTAFSTQEDYLLWRIKISIG